MRIFFTFLCGIFLAGFFSVTLADAPQQTAKNVNLQKYMGTWYEIASFPNRFQQGCQCTKAKYQIQQGQGIQIINTCMRGNPRKMTQAIGKGWVVNSSNSRLKTQFYWPLTGDYWILYVSPDYQYAVVGTPSRNYLWFLARRPTISAAKFTELKKIATQNGYSLNGLQKTVQSCT